MIKNPRHIWAVGRNYLDHAKEMKAQVPQEPMIFLKAGGCAHFEREIPLPSWSKEIHHEIELALKFDKDLQFSEYALALDLTERHYQSQAKAQGTPWTLAKSFKNACPVSAFHKIPHEFKFEELDIELEINGVIKQKGSLRDLIFSVPVLRDHITKYFPVEEGDWLLTGTPAGVGPLERGDQLKARLSNLIAMNWVVV